MADKNFSDFSNQASPLIGDFVVGYRGTTEQRYTLEVISGLIAAGPLTTAGDLWGYSTQNARVPVGTSGQVLIADPSYGVGVKWDDAGAGTVASVTNVGDGSGVISGTVGNAVKVKSINLAGGLFFPDGMGTPGDTITISGLGAFSLGPASNVGDGTGILQSANTTVTTGNLIYGDREANWYAGTLLRLISDGTTGRAYHYYPSNGKIKMVRNSPHGTFHAGFASAFEKVDVDTSSLNFMTLSGAGTVGIYGLGLFGGEVGSVIVISGSGAGNWQNNGSKLYYNDGNVGIGTADPQETLHITGGQIISGDNGSIRLSLQSDGSASNYISFTNPAGLSYIGADKATNSGFYVIADNNLPLYLGHVNDQAMRIDYKSNGESNVVIGDIAARPGEGDEVLTLRRTGADGVDGPTLLLESDSLPDGGDQMVRFQQSYGDNAGSWAMGHGTVSAAIEGKDWKSFKLAYSGGVGAKAELGIGDKLIIDTTGNIKVGSSGVQNLGTATMPLATGYFSDFYVDGAQVATSFWTKVGDDIKYTDGEVGIGLTPSVGMLEVSGDGKDALVLYSTSNASNFNLSFDDTEDAGAHVMWKISGANQYYMGMDAASVADSPSKFWFLYDASRLEPIATYYRHQMALGSYLNQQSGVYQLTPPRATNIPGNIWLGTVQDGRDTYSNLNSTGLRVKSAHPFRIAAEKGMVPSGDGVVSLGSSDHSWATGLFTNVGIGDNDPRTLSNYPFMLTDTAGTQTLANFSGNNSNYAAVRAEGATGSHSLPSRVSLAAGYDAGLPAGHENQGGGLLANSQITFHVGSTLIAHMTGRAGYGCLIVGNDYHSNTQKGNYAETHEPSVLVFGHSDDNSAKLELVNTGSIARNNKLGFVHGSNTESDTKSRWTLVQDITGDGDQDNSDFVIAYKEGDGETDLNTDTVVALTASKHMLPGASGTQNVGSYSKSWNAGHFDEGRIPKLYITGSAGSWMQITGGGGEVTIISGNLWSQVGDDIKYTAGEVGVGLAPSAGMLEVSGDAKDGLVVYSNSNASNFNAVFDDTEDAGAHVMWKKDGANQYYMGMDTSTTDSPSQFWFLYDASGLDAIATYYRNRMAAGTFTENQHGVYQLSPLRLPISKETSGWEPLVLANTLSQPYRQRVLGHGQTTPLELPPRKEWCQAVVR